MCGRKASTSDLSRKRATRRQHGRRGIQKRDSQRTQTVPAACAHHEKRREFRHPASQQVAGSIERPGNRGETGRRRHGRNRGTDRRREDRSGLGREGRTGWIREARQASAGGVELNPRHGESRTASAAEEEPGLTRRRGRLRLFARNRRAGKSRKALAGNGFGRT